MPNRPTRRFAARALEIARLSRNLAKFSRERIQAVRIFARRLVEALVDGLVWAKDQAKKFARWVWRTYWRIENGLLDAISEVVLLAYAARQIVLFLLVGLFVSMVLWLLLRSAAGSAAGIVVGVIFSILWISLLFIAPRFVPKGPGIDEAQWELEHYRLKEFLKKPQRIILRIFLSAASLLVWYGPIKAYDQINSLERPPWKHSAMSREQTGNENFIENNNTSTIGKEAKEERASEAPPKKSSSDHSSSASVNRRPTASQFVEPTKPAPVPIQVESSERILSRVDRLFKAGRCAEAKRECDNGLRIHPGNSALKKLKERIESTQALGYC